MYNAETVNDLIRMLIRIKMAGNGDKKIMVADHSGILLDFNSVRLYTITDSDADDSGDCERRVGERVVRIS